MNIHRAHVVGAVRRGFDGAIPPGSAVEQRVIEEVWKVYELQDDRAAVNDIPLWVKGIGGALAGLVLAIVFGGLIWVSGAVWSAVLR